MAHLPSNMERGEEIRARMLEDAPTDTPWLNAGDECAKKGGGRNRKIGGKSTLVPFSISNPPPGMQMMYPSLGE